jgi:hypothetical protein
MPDERISHGRGWDENDKIYQDFRNDQKYAGLTGRARFLNDDHAECREMRQVDALNFQRDRLSNRTKSRAHLSFLREAL